MQAEVINLETRLKACHEARQQLEQRFDDLAELEKENQQLTEQLQTAGASVQPDYEAIRDRALAKLKMGKQSTAGKAIEAFIKELKHAL